MMSSDSDESIDAPPPEYLQMRRRSNTLPTDILRNLKDKHVTKKSVTEPSELGTKLRRYLARNDATTNQPIKRDVAPRKLPPLERKQSQDSPDSSPASVMVDGRPTTRAKLNILEQSKRRKNGFGSLQHVNGSSANRGGNTRDETIQRACSSDSVRVQSSQSTSRTSPEVTTP